MWMLPQEGGLGGVGDGHGVRYSCAESLDNENDNFCWKYTTSVDIPKSAIKSYSLM